MRQNGFSILEMVVSMALMLIMAGVAIALVDPGRASFAAQLEGADMQQRLRVASGAIYKDLLMAGAGAYQSANKGALSHYFAPILPYRQGTNNDDPAGTFKTDTITLMYVPPTAAQTTLATSGPGVASAPIGVNWVAGCPAWDAACGFKNGMTALLFDANGVYDTFTITNVQSNVLQVERTSGTLTYANYQPGATTIVQLATSVYYLKSDPSAGTYQLMSRDGGTGADAPVVDHLVALTFDYYGDSQPPMLIKTPGDPVGPWTTYGPPPPALEQQIPTAGYPAGENCTFMVDPISSLQVPRLAVLDSRSEANALVHLTSADLTDGPWCPDGLNANRWDADLLRIRRIGVTLKVESANAALRGPASVLFAHGGTSKSGSKWLPDRQVTFQVSPRNLN
jgi:prepilin-type N-terminal cleavage/methylation domain-containing protein